MTTMELLQKAIDYAEENLKCELKAAELAEIAGYSIYHFCHLFCGHIGMPVSAFITKRRLYHVIYDVQSGEKMIDAALTYGFNTHAGFFKAFKREFGCSPTKFLKLNTVNKPTAVDLVGGPKIMLTQTQIRQLLSNWDIDPSLEIGNTFMAGGAIKSNDTWTISEAYVFKTGKDIAGLKTHIDISEALEKNGLSATCPIKTKEGLEFIREDDRYYVLTKRITGEFLTPEQRYTENRFETSKKYGVAIGNLHKVLKEQEGHLEVDESNLLDMVVNWALPETKRLMEQWGCPLPEEFYEDYKDNFSKFYSHLPKQIIHRDPNPSNVMFSNGEVSGFNSFVISERNVRIFDPCYCATGILSEAVNVEDGFEKWEEILKGLIYGYDSICKLSDFEKQSIQYVIYSIQMIFIAWLAQEDIHVDMALQNRKMLVWIWQNKEKLFSDL